MAEEGQVLIRSGKLEMIPGGDVILTGYIDKNSLSELRVGSYQREVLPLRDPEGLKEAYTRGAVQYIELGVRGR